MGKAKIIQRVLSEYDLRNLSIGTLGSHSALNIFKGAKEEGFRTICVCKKSDRVLYERFPVADEIIEETKEIIKTKGEKTEERKIALILIWTDCLKILHPFMPFVTEEIWQIINSRPESGSRQRSGLLMIEQWPS